MRQKFQGTASSGVAWPSRHAGWLWAMASSVWLAACGGGDPDASSQAQNTVASDTASATTLLALEATALPDAAAQQLVWPTFHVAPVVLTPPDDRDAWANDSSARMGPRQQTVPASLSRLSTRRLVWQRLEAAEQAPVRDVPEALGEERAQRLAAGSVVSTYSPAQVRAAYGLPVLPASFTGLSASQAASLGAGQTIYIVDAMHDPNVAAELAAFNQKFGLPGCASKSIATNAALPLAPASSSACELAVVYSTANAGMTSSAPAYDAGWATEITLDVQWAHALAPLARIVLLEAPDASINSLLGVRSRLIAYGFDE